MTKSVEVKAEASQEFVALQLAERIADVSTLHLQDDFREKYLDLYAECLKTVRAPGARGQE